MPQPVKNGRPTTRKRKEQKAESEPQEQPPFVPLGEHQIVSDDAIENMRLRGQNALLNAELLSMRNELIKAKQEIERLIGGKDQEGKASDK